MSLYVLFTRSNSKRFINFNKDIAGNINLLFVVSFNTIIQIVFILILFTSENLNLFFEYNALLQFLIYMQFILILSRLLNLEILFFITFLNEIFRHLICVLLKKLFFFTMWFSISDEFRGFPERNGRKMSSPKTWDFMLINGPQIQSLRPRNSIMFPTGTQKSLP